MAYFDAPGMMRAPQDLISGMLGPQAAPPPSSDPVQAVVAQAIQALPQPETTPAYAGVTPGPESQASPTALAQTPGKGAAPMTVGAGYDLYAGQGAGGFGQGSVGTEGSQPQRRTTAVFK